MSTVSETLVKMVESLPEEMQERILREVQALLEDLRDERVWEEKFNSSGDRLGAVARKVRQEIADGKASPMDYEKL